MTAFLTGCAKNKTQSRLNESAKVKTRVKVVTKVVQRGKIQRSAIRGAAAEALKQPPGCNQRVLARVARMQDQDLIIRRYDGALGAANDKLQACFKRNEDNRRQFIASISKIR